MPGIDLAEFAERIRTLNAPEQGMNYRGAHSGERRYNEFDGKEYYTRGEPATLTVYGERAQLLYDLIRNCAEIAAALSTPVAQGDEARDAKPSHLSVIPVRGHPEKHAVFDAIMGDAIAVCPDEIAAQRVFDALTKADATPVAQGDEIRDALEDLEVAERNYRLQHDLHGDDDMRAGKAWDEMRRAGDRARATLTKGARDAG